MELLKKLYQTIKPFWDFRVLILVGLSLGFALYEDTATMLGMLGYFILVPTVWGIALLIMKVLRPGVSSSVLIDKAAESPVGAAIVYASNRLVLIAVALSFIYWWAGK